MPPTVSINLCCYNSEKFLEKTLQSIFSQTYKEWELVVINDGSTDATEQIIQRRIAEGWPIVYHYQANAGLGRSRNKAFELSQGAYFAIIDHDDLWLPAKLEKQVKVLDEHPEVDFLYSNFYKIIMPNENKLILGHKKRQPVGNVFESFLYHYPVNLQTVLFRRTALEGLDHYFDENLNLSEEFDLFMRILYKSMAIYIHEPLAIYRIHLDMCSIKYIDKYPQENAYIIEKLVNTNTSISSKFENAINYHRAKIAYWEARALMIKKNTTGARIQLKPYRSLDYKFLFLYLLTFLPQVLWVYLHRLKDGGKFSWVAK
jgi:glycosyltransferase involved in cell wall biosynthesis